MQHVHRAITADHQFSLHPAFGPVSPLPDLAPGTPLEIVKLDPDGEHVVTYPGRVLPNSGQPDWLVTEARWVNKTVDLDGLVFHTGDRLIESFSARYPFNCFAVLDPETDALRGWYANVTYPVRVQAGSELVRVTWHDLYLDVIGNPGGYLSLRDEDELAESGLKFSNPALHAAILGVAEHVMDRMSSRAFPFVP